MEGIRHIRVPQRLRDGVTDKMVEDNINEAYKEIKKLASYSKLSTNEKVQIEHYYYSCPTAERFLSYANEILSQKAG